MPAARNPSIAVVGAGPAGLAAAEQLAKRGCRVTVIERMPSPARKFLLAGRGGLNLTHSEPLDRFLGRYGAAADVRLLAAIRANPPEAIVRWCEGLAQDTFVGSSGRIFPKVMKASPLLRAWLARLDGLGVTLRTRTEWRGFGDGQSLRLASGGVETVDAYDGVVLALGGASWPRLGADGSWVPLLAADGVAVTPLGPANAGIVLAWSDILRTRHAGEPLKRIALTVAGSTFRGEALLTRAGLEGGAVYAASEALREALQSGPARLTLDLRPDLAVTALATRIAATPAKQSLANRLRKAGLSPAAIGVLRDGIGPLPSAADKLAAYIKAVPLTTTGFTGLDRAISTAGGIAADAIDENWMLKARPGIAAAGEMLDWSAPTGGYLLTACIATGIAAAEGLLGWGVRERGWAVAT